MGKKIISMIMAVLGAYMLYLGWKLGAQPPAVTGIGFFSLAAYFFAVK